MKGQVRVRAARGVEKWHDGGKKKEDSPTVSVRPEGAPADLSDYENPRPFRKEEKNNTEDERRDGVTKRAGGRGLPEGRERSGPR